MQRQDFHFDLPEEQIAQMPLSERSASRLLCLNRQEHTRIDAHFPSIVERLNPGDLLVFNDTRVIRARLFAEKVTGGKAEILIERILNSRECLAHMRVSKKPAVEDYLFVDGERAFQLIKREGALFHLRYTGEDGIMTFIDQHGHMPLPPYIRREDSEFDETRYQTVYAKHDGAVAAPTAGLHFTDEIIEAIKKKGVDTATVTLHVGAGTFQPVKVDTIEEHEMHSEVIELPPETAEKIVETKARGGRVVAVGTTVVRVLESVASLGAIDSYTGETEIFIYPGYEFKCVDALLTNFHLPESTLIMLVSAFTDVKWMLESYRHAVEAGYRFFSYGDAMFIE